MLADEGTTRIHSGALAEGIHLVATSLISLLDYIADELPIWRDRTDRKAETAETALTSQLCAHLISRARHSNWDFLQFRVEEPDVVKKGRKIDLVVAPSGCVVWVEGRKHVDFDTLLPIECKRLPTPQGTGRDKREYLINNHKSTGGIARFKAGDHGAAHHVGGMIAFVQHGSIPAWNTKIERWIGALSRAKMANWAATDRITLRRHDPSSRLAVLKSRHSRIKNLDPIDIQHLWIEM